MTHSVFTHNSPCSVLLSNVITWYMAKYGKTLHCRISYREGLGTSPCIMGLTTQDPYIQKEHTELYKILKFRVNWANIEQDTAIQKKCMDFRTSVRKSIHLLLNLRILQSSVCSFWIYGSCVVNPIIHGLVPRPPTYEIRQYESRDYQGKRVNPQYRPYIQGNSS